jgi:hypothetical protein
MKLRGATALVFVLLIGFGSTLFGGEDRFHEKETTMYGKARVTFAILDEEGKPQERLELVSYIKVRMGVPFTNREGLRQFDFWIEEWEVFGPSKTLEGHFIITVSKGVEQPRSFCVATQKDSDFPADVVFNAIYDVYLDDKPVLLKHRGRGVSERATRIPPETPTIIEHPFEVEGRPITKGACASTEEISAGEFEEAVAKARALRGATLRR